MTDGVNIKPINMKKVIDFMKRNEAVTFMFMLTKDVKGNDKMIVRANSLVFDKEVDSMIGNKNTMDMTAYCFGTIIENIMQGEFVQSSLNRLQHPALIKVNAQVKVNPRATFSQLEDLLHIMGYSTWANIQYTQKIQNTRSKYLITTITVKRG